MSSDDHFWAGTGDEEDTYVSHTSASGIWTEGVNIHSDGGIFCPDCLEVNFYSWMYVSCIKCGYERPPERR